MEYQNVTESDDTFLGDRNFDEEEQSDISNVRSEDYTEPVELIVSRVIFALLVSVSLVLNLLLLLASIRRRKTTHVIYCFAVAMLIPDLIFYSKLVVELMNWGEPDPSWARNNWSCALWQYATHLYPILYSVLILAIVYHAFITLFLDYSGSYEDKSKKFFPIILSSLVITCCFITAPSALYSETRTESAIDRSYSHFRQYCDLNVPSLIASEDLPELRSEATAAYRLVYELILPYILPLVFVAFPYITLLIGLLRSVPAASHSEYATKMTVVVTLWLLTSYLMLHVCTVLRNVFAVFSVWHRLMAMFDAMDDERVPKFETYIHITAYSLTCLWGIIRAAMCFKYNIKLRKALGP